MSARRTVALTASALWAVLALGACRAPQDEIVEVYVPSEEEARTAADQRITPDNADQEFEDLAKEIESDG